MNINYLMMIWNVKIFLAKIKDCKGKDLNQSDKKKLPTKTPPEIEQKPLTQGPLKAILKQIGYMKWREIVNDYLSFTRKERIGILTVLLILTIAVLFPVVFSSNNSTGNQSPDTAWIAAAKSLELKEKIHEKNYPDENETDVRVYQYDRSANNAYNNSSRGELFYFDPNTLTDDGWQKLGLRKKTIQIIQNYVAKGGLFRKAEDLRRIYGLHKNDYERIAPYIRIQHEPPNFQLPEHTTGKSSIGHTQEPVKSFHYKAVDINSADTAAFISLPGIGSKLATRIINFRDKLGGFYSVDQVRETFGLPDSTFQTIRPYLKLNTASFKKININTASIEELKTHPYIRYAIANAIVSYRNQHGPFLTTDDIKKIMVVTDDVHQKISPYLSTQ